MGHIITEFTVFAYPILYIYIYCKTRIHNEFYIKMSIKWCLRQTNIHEFIKNIL